MVLRAAFRRVLALVALSSGCEVSKPETAWLWPGGAPGAEALRHEPEVAKDWWVQSVHNPSLTIVRPARPTGAAVIIVPGGGHERLVFGPEGLAPARFLAERGLVAFALKYRLAREAGSRYTVADAAADTARAMRWVRSHAAEYGVDPQRVGLMGWSAGAELAGLVTFDAASAAPQVGDSVDDERVRPDFLISIYPGPLALPRSVPPDAPPAFLLAAGDDELAAPVVVKLLELYQAAGVAAELHLFAAGGHGFNLGDRSSVPSIRHWPSRLADWLKAAQLGH